MQQFIRAHIAKLAADNNGTLTPDLIVEDARNPSSPLHEEFEWDDTVAAHQHRLSQARTVIRTIHITDHYRTATILRPEWVRDPDLPANQAGYISLASLESDHDRAVRALDMELSRVSSLLKRAREIAMTLNLVDEIDVYIAALAVFKESVAPAAAVR